MALFGVCLTAGCRSDPTWQMPWRQSGIEGCQWPAMVRGANCATSAPPPLDDPTLDQPLYPFTGKQDHPPSGASRLQVCSRSTDMSSSSVHHIQLVGRCSHAERTLDRCAEHGWHVFGIGVQTTCTPCTCEHPIPVRFAEGRSFGRPLLTAYTSASSSRQCEAVH